MTYRLKAGEPPDAALRRIAVEQIDRGLADLADPALPRDETVHGLRKRMKKLRGLLRLFRGALPAEVFARENARYRDAARRIAGQRDVVVLRATLDKLLAAVPAAASGAPDAQAALAGRRGTDPVDPGDWETVLRPATVEALRAGRAALDGLTLRRDGFDAVKRGLHKTYARGRKGLGKARDNPAPEVLHDWRTQVKYGWYHARLLQDLAPRRIRARREALRRLGELLGEEHDLAVLEQALRAPGPGLPSPALAPLLDAAAARRARLRKRAFRLGRRAFAEKPRAHRRRMKRRWQAWRAVG